ncbi:LRR 8 domain containing protein [Asbolus verrucosus]|uniref:LRR 8 domain containing protein n=1 Tax=Asbolus verrucosus TaxID=1661398 RepID=A0A482V687_ASBVE|nr:LRR 8 domain containing protein [Asbolus verrucosus]
MTLSGSALFVTLTLLLSPTKCAVFENVTLSLSTGWRKLLSSERPPTKIVFIESSDSLGEYVNLHPLEYVTIADQKIPELKENSLANLPNKNGVYITSSEVTKIEPGTFKNVPRLDRVHLDGNRIEEIEDGVFTNLQLRKLYLRNNKISKLGLAAFSNMTRLEDINLTYNKLSTWSSDWFSGTPVASVYIAHNLIEELPADVFAYMFPFKRISGEISIWNFIISNNRLKKVHTDAFRNVNHFGSLSLSNNSLENLSPKVFHSVETINHLHLNSNLLSNIDGLFYSIYIYNLHLDDNRLSCFPSGVFNASDIHRVSINRNPLTCDCVHYWKDQQERSIQLRFNFVYDKEKCVNI